MLYLRLFITFSTIKQVASLLESAGFSKSNPYYIVQQGKVNRLCLSKNEERLQLLKEVAGTRVYEERREESQKIMVDTNSKREKIQECISILEERLEDLEGEKEELRVYEKCDREKRALEYSIYEKELTKARKEIDGIEEQKLADADRVQELHEGLRATQDDIELQKRLTSEGEQELERLKSDRRSAEQGRAKVVAQRAKLEVEVGESKWATILLKPLLNFFNYCYHFKPGNSRLKRRGGTYCISPVILFS